MTWKQLTEKDCRELKLLAIDPHDSDTWKSVVRSAMCIASQLLGRGPTDVDVAPVNQKFDDDNDLEPKGQLTRNLSGTHLRDTGPSLLSCYGYAVYVGLGRLWMEKEKWGLSVLQTQMHPHPTAHHTHTHTNIQTHFVIL